MRVYSCRRLVAYAKGVDVRSHLLVISAAVAISSIAAPVHAATTCVFDTQGQRMALRGSCQTDATIAIPDGFTLDGRGRRIVAVDPSGGHFLGAVVRNAGASANVRNLVIEARALASVCDGSGPPDQRLAGILLENASGTITNSRVLGINQGQSGCQEGAAIAVRADQSGEGQARSVQIVGNRVAGYQKTGILVNGNVDAVVDRNRVEGLGPVDFIGQNGIQLGFGARGSVTRNEVAQNLYTQPDAASAGILIWNAGPGVEVARNRIEDCDVGVRLIASSEALVEDNRISDSTYEGIAIDGQSGPSEGSLIVGNVSISNPVGIGLHGAGARFNTVEDNAIYYSAEAAIFVDPLATDNTVRDNRVVTAR
jgi:parallel beta-helix repeat protein